MTPLNYYFEAIPIFRAMLLTFRRLIFDYEAARCVDEFRTPVELPPPHAFRRGCKQEPLLFQ